uniref:Hydroxyacid-oxoacid transhydrogenase, mitochondrial n=1 Tax=Salmo salar TaxID=8030 RepID=B5XAL1_SALSA|nr:Hydroxyacid-oxoacid transhydrogenase, mitochondrial precursor [Salmo salar]
MAGRDRIVHLLRQLEKAACRCPAHSHTFHQASGHDCGRKTDYAFEMASSNIRYGEGVTREIGMDLQNMGARNVCPMTGLHCYDSVASFLESRLLRLTVM